MTEERNEIKGLGINVQAAWDVRGAVKLYRSFW